MSSITDHSSIKTLLDSLQALYMRLSAQDLKERMTSYRKGDSALLDKQILSALYSVVEQTPVAEVRNGQVAESGSVTSADEGLTDPQEAQAVAKEGSVKAPETPQKDLSNRLHSTLSRSSGSIHLGEKLRVSAWDHIRTSLRYVREKNPDLAKMHADLANEALQQASHYMTDDEYIELKAAVLDELQKLRG